MMALHFTMAMSLEVFRARQSRAPLLLQAAHTREELAAGLAGEQGHAISSTEA
jgi:hypothetical protein